jgi:hypothetical protein
LQRITGPHPDIFARRFTTNPKDQSLNITEVMVIEWVAATQGYAAPTDPRIIQIIDNLIGHLLVKKVASIGAPTRLIVTAAALVLAPCDKQGAARTRTVDDINTMVS